MDLRLTGARAVVTPPRPRSTPSPAARGRARSGSSSRAKKRRQQDLVRPLQLAVRPFQGLDPPGVVGRGAGPLPRVDIGPLDPPGQGVRVDHDPCRSEPPAAVTDNSGSS